jgi:alpha-tubulin suppressor-like RCC1 family protein
MNKDMATEILLNADFRDIFNLCQLNTLFNQICQSNSFWRKRYLQDYGNDGPAYLPGGNWREAYRIRYQSKLYMFGDNTGGQLGTGDEVDRLVPTRVTVDNMDNIIDIVDLSCGYLHTGVVTGGGKLWMFGNNIRGQLGDRMGNSDVPVEHKSLTDVVRVSCRMFQTGVVTKDGKLRMFGDNPDGQLGNGTNVRSFIPVEIQSLTNVIDVSCGEYHTGAVTADGKLWMFGSNTDGQLGDGTRNSSNVPILIATDVLGDPIDVVQVSCGKDYTGIVTRDGKVYMFGLNNDGQLGKDGLAITDRPIRVELLTDAIQISCGSYHTGVVTKTGKLYTFGVNICDELGIDDDVEYMEPVEITTVRGAVQVSCGKHRTGVIDRNGKVHLFGEDCGLSFNGIDDIQYARIISCGNDHNGVVGHMRDQ